MFDLARTLLCAGQDKRSAQRYDKAINLLAGRVSRLQGRHPLLRRGLITVALAGLRQAFIYHTELDQRPASDMTDDIDAIDRCSAPRRTSERSHLVSGVGVRVSDGVLPADSAAVTRVFHVLRCSPGTDPSDGVDGHFLRWDRRGRH